MSGVFIKILNVCLRGLTLASRFVFIFFLAKYLDPAQVGQFGIFTATVSYALYCVGLDFYTYVSREITKAPSDKRGQLLKGQAALSVIIYATLLPLALVALAQTNWPEHLIWWFFPILFLEHFNQEAFRLLVALSEQLTASLVLFIRQGMWAIIAVVVMAIDDGAKNLDTVIFLWVVAGVIATGISLWKIKSLKMKGWLLPVDWRWLKKGLRVSVAFLVATLALRGLQTFDRYFLEAIGGIEMVGAYVLLLGVAGTLLVFLDAAVFSFAYPDLIRHHQLGELDQLQRRVWILFIQTVFIALSFSFISLLILPHLLNWIGNEIYLQARHWYPWLLSAMIVNGFSLIPHYALYAQGKDRHIIISHILSIIIFLIIVYIFSEKYKESVVPLALNVAFLVVLIWKWTIYFISLYVSVRSNCLYDVSSSARHASKK